MVVSSDSGAGRASLSGEVSKNEVNMDLTMCGLLVERAEELSRLYREYGNWNDVKDEWFEERISNRSTRGSSQKIFRVLTDRLKNAPQSLPNPKQLPELLAACNSKQSKAQILYCYLVANDTLVRYTVFEYVERMSRNSDVALAFSDDRLFEILSNLTFTDGSSFDYAESTTQRWCEGFRSVMREIGVLDEQATVGSPPSLEDVPLLVGLAYSYDETDSGWVEEPFGLEALFQPHERWQECFDRAADSGAWEYVETAGTLELRPTEEGLDGIGNEGVSD